MVWMPWLVVGPPNSVGHREVLDLDLVVEVVDHGADLGPVAEQVEQVVHGVDALAGGRAAELRGPSRGPRPRSGGRGCRSRRGPRPSRRAGGAGGPWCGCPGWWSGRRTPWPIERSSTSIWW